MTRSPSLTLVPLLALLAVPTISQAATIADELSDLREAVSFGKVSGTARLRFENVDQTGPATVTNEANATTLRAALGYETKSYHGVSGFIQFEGVFGLNGDDHYRSSENGKTTFPFVGDTPTVEMNQAYGQYICPKDPWKTTVRWGRQEINLGNQRLVGAVAWRQDTQTFDGGGVSTTPYNSDGKSLMLGYNYVYRVNRIFPDEVQTNPFQGRLDMESHIAQALVKVDGIGQLHAYGLFLDYDDDYAVAVTRLSTSTVGARLSGTVAATPDIGVLYGLEYASQSDYGSSDLSYTAAYYQGEVGASYMGVTLKYGYNVLEGNDDTGIDANNKFTTPLATGHAFNGWCDLFLVTPQNGLEAHQISLSYNPPFLKGLTVSAIYYRFDTEATGEHLGNEIDLLAEYKVASFPGLLFGVKYADFAGDETAGNLAGTNVGIEDVTKFWAYTQYTF
jgi:hypothetical protein